MNKILTCFLVALLNAGVCQTNKDRTYIVLKSDTIYGLIKYQNFDNSPSKISFRKSESEEWREYFPQELSAFMVAGVIFESQQVRSDFSSVTLEDIRSNSRQNVIRDTTLFLTVGYQSELVTLYQHADRNEKVHFFIKKGTRKIEELVKKCTYQDGLLACRNVYWQTLRFYFSDCEKMSDKRITNTDFTRQSFEKLFDEYIKCKNGIVPAGRPSSISRERVFAFIVPGVTSLSFSGYPAPPNSKIPGLVNAKFQSAFSIQAGMGIEVTPRLNQRLALNGELSVRYFSIQSTREFTYSVSSTTNKQSFTFTPTYVRLSPAIRYHLSEAERSPYLSGGVSLEYAIFFSSDYELVETYAAGFQTTTRDKALTSSEFNPLGSGYFIGVGWRTPKINFEIRYEKGPGMIQNHIMLSTDMRNFGLYVGYNLNKSK